MKRRKFLLGGASILGGLALPRPSSAQSKKYPELPIKLIVPFAAGGGVDAYARLLGETVKAKTGYSVVIENRAGSNGVVGGLAVRGAEPDGYNLLFSAATHVVARDVMKSVPYDPLVDFTPIARVGEAPMMVVMAPDRKPRTLAQVIAEAKAAPDKWTFSTAALGAPGHLATVAFNHLAGLNITIIPYRGTAPALTDVAGGHVQLLIDPILALLPMAQDKSVIPLAVTTKARTKLAPDIPTAAESGLPGLEYSSWYGIWGPQNLPAGITQQVNQMFTAAVKELEANGRLAQLGIEPVTETPQEFSAFSKDYVSRMGAMLKAANFNPL